MTYAVARLADETLLYVGDDFAAPTSRRREVSAQFEKRVTAHAICGTGSSSGTAVARLCDGVVWIYRVAVRPLTTDQERHPICQIKDEIRKAVADDHLAAR